MKEPRVKKKIRHKFGDIIAITICAAICGADDLVSVKKTRK